MALAFNTDFDPRHGELVDVSPLVRRMTAPNPGAFTFHGTNTYVIGHGRVAIIDPGPDDPRHVAALVEALGNETITHILVTHTHHDHSPAARSLQRLSGAPTLGEGPHRPARPLDIGETNPLDASADGEFRPDIGLGDGARIEGEGWTLETVLTPGHTDNHATYALAEEGILFSGDHVMGWSTTVVAPPDGSMRDYMASLDKLMARNDRRYLPAHGSPIEKPADHVAELRAHRLAREAEICGRVAQGDETIPAIVASIYADIDRRLHGAAALSVLAHLEDLVARGLVACTGRPALDGRYRPA